jgi:predicted metal-binding protein
MLKKCSGKVNPTRFVGSGRRDRQTAQSRGAWRTCFAQSSHVVTRMTFVVCEGCHGLVWFYILAHQCLIRHSTRDLVHFSVCPSSGAGFTSNATQEVGASDTKRRWRRRPPKESPHPIKLSSHFLLAEEITRVLTLCATSWKRRRVSGEIED